MPQMVRGPSSARSQAFGGDKRKWWARGGHPLRAQEWVFSFGVVLLWFTLHVTSFTADVRTSGSRTVGRVKISRAAGALGAVQVSVLTL